MKNYNSQNLLKLDLQKINTKSARAMVKWPFAKQETQGYIVLKQGKVTFLPSVFVSVKTSPTGVRVRHVPGSVPEKHYDFEFNESAPHSNTLVYLSDRKSRRRTVILLGTFHSHPFGCREKLCYHQPPSVIDINSFRRLTMDLGLPAHVVISRKKLYFVRTLAAPQHRFDALVGEFRGLLEENVAPDLQEPRWFEIAGRYRDVMAVDLIVPPKKRDLPV